MALYVKVGEFVVVVLRCCINWYQMPVEATRFFYLIVHDFKLIGLFIC